MLATYGVDVLDPHVSLRRMHVLLQRLPPGSAPAAESPAAWSVESHLLAAVFDQLAALTWVTIAANSKSTPTRPRPIPRPGHAAARGGEQRPKMPWRDLAGVLGKTPGMVNRRGR